MDSENKDFTNEEMPVVEEGVVAEQAVEKELIAKIEEKSSQTSGSSISRSASRPDGVTVLAIYHFLISIPGLIAGCALLVFPLPAVLSEGSGLMDLLGTIFGVSVGLLFTLGISGLSIATAAGLLKMKGWARWLAIAQEILALLAFPIGTVIGALALIYLLQDSIKKEFEKVS